MVLDFQAALQMKQVKLTDKPTTDEFRQYQVKSGEGATSKYSAPKGLHDDRVMSTVIAWQCLKDVKKPLNKSQKVEREHKKKERKKKRFISSVCGY